MLVTLPVPTLSLQIKKHFPRVKGRRLWAESHQQVVMLEHHSHISSSWKRLDLRRSLAQPPPQSRLGCEIRPELYPLGSWKPLRTEMTQTPWVLAPPPDHPHGKKISAHGHSEPLISSYVCFISSSHYAPPSRTCLSSRQPSPSHWGTAVGPPPWSHIFSRLNKLNSLSLSLQGKCSSPNKCDGLYWTYFSLSITFPYWGTQTWMQYLGVI